MRIIAGNLKGKNIKAPEGMATRPTADRARETLFDIISSYFLKRGQIWSDIVFADIFSGSGAVGIEALSRGAKQVVCMENNRAALICLKENVQGFSAIRVMENDALIPPRYQPVSVLFMDAPYGKGLWQQALVAFSKNGWVDGKTLIIIETDKKLKEMLPDGYDLLQERSAGRNTFLFAKRKEK